MADRKKEEAAVETVLNQLHKQYISVHDDTIKAYVDHFMKVLNHLIVLMKEEDVLFKAMYRKICGAGSYYDGLKVGKPEEFDVDIVIRLPVSYEEITPPLAANLRDFRNLITAAVALVKRDMLTWMWDEMDYHIMSAVPVKIVNNRSVPPAFTKVKITTKAMDILRQRPDWASTYRSMDKWRDKDGFLLQSEFRQWVESVVNKALNRLRRNKPNCYELEIQDPDASGRLSQYHISLKKSGPAMTFTVTMLPSNAKVDVDFVPVIEFTHPKWPAGSVRPLSDQLIKAKRTSWFIVPKPKSKTGDADQTLWRLAFHEQERELINDRGTLKPVCRLLKKLRDSCQLNIASYYLKTLFLWEIDTNKAPDFWKMKQGHLFMHMLKIFQQNLKRGEIKYYWDKRCNLIEGFQEKHKENLVCRLDNIIAHIEKNVSESPIVIAEHILSKEEFEDFKKNCSIIVPSPSKPVAAVPNRATEIAVVRSPNLQGFRHTSGVPCSLCVDMSSKLDTIINALTSLQSRVHTLDGRINILCADIRSIRNQLQFNSAPRVLNVPHQCL